MCGAFAKTTEGFGTHASCAQVRGRAEKARLARKNGGCERRSFHREPLPPTCHFLASLDPPDHVDPPPDTEALIPRAPEHHSPVQNLDPPLRPDPSSAPPPAPRSFSGARIKVPNYSPSRRPLGGVSFGPLPSPGVYLGASGRGAGRGEAGALG